MQNSKKTHDIRCRVEGCDRMSMYKEKQLCQKHYFRIMRNGHERLLMSSEIERGERNRKDFHITPNGYKRIFAKDHPLSRKHWVFEHRFVVYKKYGNNLPDCEICGKKINWGNCHVDHIDENRLNNDISNLRPLCRGCNTTRNPKLEKHEYVRNFAVTFEGETKTPHEWSKDSRVNVAGNTIRRRKNMGMSDFDALFSEKKTHKEMYKNKLKELASL